MAALAIGMVLASALGAVCCTVGRRHDAVLCAAMAVMTVAMVDTGLAHGRLLPPYGWAVVLTVLAVAVGASGRGCRRTWDRVAHLGVMAGLTALMAWPGSGAAMAEMPGMSGMPGMPGMSAASTAPLWPGYVALALACGYVIRLAVAEEPGRSPALVVVERAASAIAVVAMAAMLAFV